MLSASLILDSGLSHCYWLMTEDGQVHTEVLPDADTTASHLAEDTGEPRLRLVYIVADVRQTVRSNEQMMQSMKGATSTSPCNPHRIRISDRT